MAQFSACRTPLQNLPFDGKDKLAAVTSKKGNNTFPMLRARTLAITLPVISALLSVAQHLENEL